LTFSAIFILECAGNVQTEWYLFVRVSILTLSTIFLLDCGGNVQTGWYLFVRVSILTFSKGQNGYPNKQIPPRLNISTTIQ
jgi:hypothetical protein